MAYRKLGRTCKHRRSMLASQVKDVIMCGKIKTTETRAKETRKFVDKMISYAKDGSLVARRKALAFLHNDKEVVNKLFNELAPKYENRNGGYTRILKLNERRGDDALIVILELVEEETVYTKVSSKSEKVEESNDVEESNEEEETAE